VNAKLTPRESFVLYGAFIALGFGLFVLGLYWGKGQTANLSQEITTEQVAAAVRPVDTPTRTVAPQGRLEVPPGQAGSLAAKESESVASRQTQTAAKPLSVEVKQDAPSRTVTPVPAAQPPVVQPDAVKTKSAPGTSKGAFSIQVGALKTEEEARKVLSRLQFRGYTGILDQPASQKDPFFRVRVGSYETREAAERAEELLKKEGFLTFIKKMN